MKMIQKKMIQMRVKVLTPTLYLKSVSAQLSLYKASNFLLKPITN